MSDLRMTLLLGFVLVIFTPPILDGWALPPSVDPIIKLSQGKQTKQSSTYNIPNVDSSKGVDGVKDQGTFHTNLENNPWWEVDLGEKYRVDYVMLFNRTDCCGERAGKVTVLLSDDGKQWTNVYSHNGTTFKSLRVDTPGKSSRFVRIQLADRNYLHLAEVEVWGRSFKAAPPTTVPKAPPPAAGAKTPASQTTSQTAAQAGAQTTRGAAAGKTASVPAPASGTPGKTTAATQPKGTPAGAQNPAGTAGKDGASGTQTPTAGKGPAATPPKTTTPAVPPKSTAKTPAVAASIFLHYGPVDAIWRVTKGLAGVGNATGAVLPSSGELPVPESGSINLAFQTGNVPDVDPGYGSLEVSSGKKSWKNARDFEDATEDKKHGYRLAAEDTTFKGLKAIQFQKPNQVGHSVANSSFWEGGTWCLADPENGIWVGWVWSQGASTPEKRRYYQEKLNALMQSFRINRSVPARR
jgi:hypothetical protein